MPEKKRVYTPTRGYDIQLKIKDLDYTNDLRSVRVISSINTAYQIVTLTINIDPNSLILEDVMGKEPLKLSIRLLGRGSEESIPQEEVKMDLMYVKSSSSAPVKIQQSDSKMLERTNVNIITVCRTPFKIMNSIVNDVFFEKTPKQIIESLITKAGGIPNYDTDGENKEIIEQIILPPITLYKSIRYLDDNFGLFNGACNLGFCQYDNNVYVQNLTTRMNKNQEFIIYHLSLDDPQNNEIIDRCSDGNNFYTYTQLVNQYNGSSKFASIAKKVRHIVKPSDSLYSIVEQELDEVCLSYGAISNQPEMIMDTDNDREDFKNEFSEGYSVSKIARDVIGFSTVEFDLEKNLPILKLMKIGESVKLKCRTLEYTPLNGKYILKSSDINFSRIQAPDWQSTAKLTIMRTNQYI